MSGVEPRDGGPPATSNEPALVAAAAMVYVEQMAAPSVDARTAHHLLAVLRLRPGDEVVASDGRGSWAPCRIDVPAACTGGTDSQGGHGLDLTLSGPVRRQPCADPAITVAFVPVKGERAEWVVQKLTELGVDRIVPLRSARSVVRWEGDRAVRAVERLRRVAVEAAAQSRRTWLPEVTEVMSLDGLAAGATRASRATIQDGAALAHPGGGPPSLACPVVAIGPEGGWDSEELARFGVGPGLGPTVLRAETAAIAVATILCALRAGTVATLA
ncbi:MAG: RsmE family RNA methyltransferase [Acidimicrobiales bacterium]